MSTKYIIIHLWFLLVFASYKYKPYDSNGKTKLHGYIVIQIGRLSTPSKNVKYFGFTWLISRLRRVP